MQSENRRIRDLLTKTEHWDADERFMATNDLIKELEKVEGLLDLSLQEPVRNAVLRQLDDKGKDVSTIAVKCLSTLVKKFNPDQVNAVVDKMGHMIVDTKGSEEGSSKDVFVDGIRNVIAVVDDANGKAFAPPLLKTLLIGLNSTAEDVMVRMMCMDVVRDLLVRFGNEVETLQVELLNSLTKLLQSEHDAVRKRASVTLGPLVGYLDEKSFHDLMIDVIIKNIEGHNPDVYIRSVGVISKAAGTRVGEYLPKIVPPLIRYCEKEAQSEEATVELWHNCLQAFEFIIIRCPNKVTPYVDGIVTISLAKIAHDPNMVQPQSMEDVVDGDGNGQDWGDDDDEDWGDDAPEEAGALWGDEDGQVVEANASDESWKVRLAAVGVLSAFIRARSDILKRYYGELCDSLTQRFTERDASVQEEVLLACRNLLRETIVTEAPIVNMDENDLPRPILVRMRSSFNTLEDKVRGIIDKVDEVWQSGKASNATKVASFAVISELVTVLQGNMQDYFDKIMPHVITAATAKAEGALNSDGLVLLHLLLEFHTHDQLEAYIPGISEAAVQSVEQDEASRPAALRVLGSILKLLPAGGSASSGLVAHLYDATLSQLVLKDTPQSIKIAAISTMSVLLARFGGRLPKLDQQVMVVFDDRLGNDVTREQTLKAIIKVANSDADCDLSYLAKTSIPELCSFLRKASPSLKHQTVLCLEALVRTHSVAMNDASFSAILSEVSKHIADADLMLSHLVLDLVSTALKASHALGSQVASEILGRSISFLKSPLLQGDSLKSMIKFYCACVSYGGKVAKLTYSSLLSALLAVINGNVSKSVFTAVSQCVAGITRQQPVVAQNKTVVSFISDIKNKNSSAYTKAIALLSVGQIGRSIDLSGQASIDQVLFLALNSPTQSVREAAAFALGNITVGNMNKFLPLLLNLVSQRPEDQQYLLLCALKETIVAHASADLRTCFKPHLDTVTPLLFERAESNDEGVVSVVANCLGRLVVINAQKILPALCKLLTSKNEQARAVVITAFRFAFQPDVDWLYISEFFSQFFALLGDDSLDVRHQAVLTINSLLNVNSAIVSRPLMDDVVLPALYAETVVHEQYVRVVDYGNFKETVDDALPLRKAVFQCLGTLLDYYSELLDMQVYIKHVCCGLSDHADIQIATYQLFRSIAKYQPRALLEILDSIPTLIMATVKGHLKAAKTPQNKEGLAALDCLRAIVKALTTFNTIPGVEVCAKYTHFYKQICATKLLQELLAQQPSSS